MQLRYRRWRPSMLRSAAKNHASVTVVLEPADYAVCLMNWQQTAKPLMKLANVWQLSLPVMQQLMMLCHILHSSSRESKPENSLWLDRKQQCVTVKNLNRLLSKVCQQLTQLPPAKQLNGKNCHSTISVMLMLLSVISVTSKTVQQFVALKHMNPCGIGQADDIETTWDYAYESDPVSIFGGNRSQP